MPGERLLALAGPCAADPVGQRPGHARARCCATIDGNRPLARPQRAPRADDALARSRRLVRDHRRRPAAARWQAAPPVLARPGWCVRWAIWWARMAACCRAVPLGQMDAIALLVRSERLLPRGRPRSARALEAMLATAGAAAARADARRRRAGQLAGRGAVRRRRLAALIEASGVRTAAAARRRGTGATSGWSRARRSCSSMPRRRRVRAMRGTAAPRRWRSNSATRAQRI